MGSTCIYVNFNPAFGVPPALLHWPAEHSNTTISLKYLLAQLGAQPGILQPPHLALERTFPLVRLFPAFHPLSPLEPARRHVLLQKLQETLAQMGWGSKGQAQQFTLPCTQCFGQAEWVCRRCCLLTSCLKPQEPECCRDKEALWQGGTLVAPCGSQTRH